MKYRIKECYAEKHKGIWYEIEEEVYFFWLFPVWVAVDNECYKTIGRAEKEIKHLQDTKTRKLKVIKTYEI